MSPKRSKLLTALALMLAVAAFFILSSIAVVWANGLRFNPETKRFEQTVVVAVESKQGHQLLNIFLNGDLVGTEVPFQARGLLPGHYELLIQKEGFQPFGQSFQLGAGEVGVVRDFEPIAVHPSISLETERAVFSEPAFESGLRLSADGELLDRNKLVSRFIADPLLARRLNDGYVYQVADQLRLFFPQGPQDYLIYQLTTNEVAKINLRPSDWQILIQEGEVIKLIELTRPTP